MWCQNNGRAPWRSLCSNVFLDPHSDVNASCSRDYLLLLLLLLSIRIKQERQIVVVWFQTAWQLKWSHHWLTSGRISLGSGLLVVTESG